MTREEAITKIEESTYCSAQVKVVNEIYDDFESRTCESCKFVVKSD